MKPHQEFGTTARETPTDPAGLRCGCDENAPSKDCCWSVPIAMAAAAFFILLPQSCFGVIFVHFMDKFGTNRECASWPQNVAAMTSHLAGIAAFLLHRFLSSFHVVLLSAALSSLALIGSAFSPNMVWMTVTFGVFQGLGFGLFVIASTVYTIPYFDKYQAFASSMKFGTWGLAGIIGPFIVSRLILMYGLSGTLLMFGAFNLQTIPIIMLVKNPTPLHIRRLKSHDTVRCNGRRQDRVISYGSRNLHKTPPPCGRVKEVPTSKPSFSVSFRHALHLFRMPWFYVFLVAAVVGDYAAIEFGITIVDYGIDKGIEANKAKLLTTFIFSGELLGRLVLPLLADVLSLSHRSVYAFSFLCAFACMSTVPHVSSFAGVVALCITQGIAEGYCICIKYVLLADILGVQNVAASFGVYGIAMVPLSVFTPKIIGVFRDARGSYDGFYQMLGAINLAAGVLFGTFALWQHVCGKVKDSNADEVCHVERF